MIAINLSGCTYANNKNWDDLTAEEKEELQQEFESMKVELEEDFPSDRLKNQRFFNQQICACAQI